MLGLEEALLKIRQNVRPIQETERVGLFQSFGRVLACDVQAPSSLPHFKNSAMDGFALHFADLCLYETLEIVGTSYAGHPFLGSCGRGQCIRVMTGALIPEGTDTVVMQEHVAVDLRSTAPLFEKGGLEPAPENLLIRGGISPVLNRMRILKPYKMGANVRHPGEDIERGSLVIQKGTQLLAAQLGLLAALWIEEIEVICLPKIAIFSTGDELAPPGTALGRGQVYDSNRYALYGMIKALGVEPVDAGILVDSKDTIRAKLLALSETSDMVITSGGVSVGSADYVKEVLEELGEVLFWKIAIKPGKPLAFGKIGRAYFFGLPGNPASAMVTFDQFVKPALYRLMGKAQSVPLTFKLRTTGPLKKDPGRIDFQRGIIAQNKEGEWTVSSVRSQSSGALSSMSGANCYIVLPQDSSNIAVGEWVTVQPFDIDVVHNGGV